MKNQFEREMDRIELSYEAGKITREEFDAMMREVQADYRSASQEAAHNAYFGEMERW